MKVRAHFFVSGRVQGVIFREKTRREAVRLGVSGWIRNLADGRVEAVVEGGKEAVEALVEFCREGPAPSVVEGFDLKWEPVTHNFDLFSVRT
jgi:acylphosphatase